MRITLGGGCFWCLEAAYKLIEGVTKVVPGYSGGTRVNPNYETTHYANSGEAEVVQISFDEAMIDLSGILDIFWAIHDPTTLNRQGNDVGPEYQSIIFYTDSDQKMAIEQSLIKAQKLWDAPIVTELKKFDAFYEAEPEHHNYFQKNPNQAYCQIVINPKLEKLRQEFSERMKKSF